MKKRFKYVMIHELEELERVKESTFQRLEDKVRFLCQNIVFYPASHVKGKWMYYCTNCNTWHIINFRLKKGQKLRCKNCNKKLEVVHHKNIKNEEFAYLTKIEKNQFNELILRCFYYKYELKRSYDDSYFKEREQFYEIARLNYNNQIAIIKNTYTVMGYYGNLYHSMKFDDWKDDRKNYSNRMYFGSVINRNIKSLIKNTDYKYSALNLAAQNGIDVLDYLNAYKEHPEQIEILIKTGCVRLIKDVMYKYFDIRILKNLRKSDLKTIIKNNLNYKELEIYLKTHIDDLSFLKKAVKVGYNDNSKNSKNIVNYLFKKKETYVIYKDYLDMAELIGMNINDNKILYPEDLKKAHNDVLKAYESVKNKKINEGIKKRYKMFESLAFNDNKLIIRPVQTQNELINESKILNHCVRTYAEKVAKGKTEIFFIRQKNKEDEPYVTLELNESNVVQCRAKNNAIPNARVKKLVNLWCKINHFSSCFDVE